MLLTEKQRQSYMEKEHLVSSLSNLLKYTEVKNLPDENEPYVLKDLFGSKRGLLVRASKLNKDIEKIYKEANKIRKKGIAPKYLSRRYLNELLDNNFISENEFITIKGYEKALSDLEKEAKQLGRKIEKKTHIKDIENSTDIICCSAVICSAASGGLLLFPFVAVIIWILETRNEIMRDKSIDIREVKSDYEKCQRNRMPGISPYLIFLKDENGKIGLPLSHYLVAFEPQSDIKHFYDSYQRFTTNFAKFLKTDDAGLFFSPTAEWKNIRPLWKALRDQEKLVTTTVAMAEKLVAKIEKSHKGKSPKDKKGKWKNSEIFIYSLAQYLTKLKYTGLKQDELKTKLAKMSGRSLKSSSSGEASVDNFVKTIVDNPTVEVQATTVEATPLAKPKEGKPIETKKITVIEPPKYELPPNVKQLVTRFDKYFAGALTSSPEDFSPLNV